MTTAHQETQTPAPLRTVGARLWSAVLAVWGTITGLAPHILHHVGPLAGAAFLVGAGQLLFAVIALVVSIPFLLRLRRRFHSWAAPVIALVVMTATFSLSTFVIGPAIRSDDKPAPRSGIEQPAPDEHGH